MYANASGESKAFSAVSDEIEVVDTNEILFRKFTFLEVFITKKYAKFFFNNRS